MPATRPCSRGRSNPRSALIPESVIALPFPLVFLTLACVAKLSFCFLCFFILLSFVVYLLFVILSVSFCWPVLPPILNPLPVVHSHHILYHCAPYNCAFPFPSLPLLSHSTRVERSLHWSPTPHTSTTTGSAWLPSPATISSQFP